MSRDGHRYWLPERLLKLQQHPKGYVRFQFSGGPRDGQTTGVHRLVLEAFVGPCPEGMEALHGNAIRNDNRLCNLRWDTKSENSQDRVRHGHHHLANRDRCAYGHLLVEANFAPSRPKRGRECLACYTAQRDIGSRKWRGVRPSRYARQQLADRYYDRLGIEGGTGTGYRGLQPEDCNRGEENHCAKLTEVQVREARRAHVGGVSYRTLSERYGVSHGTIWSAVTGRTWAHVEDS